MFGTPRGKDDLPRFLQNKTCSVHQEERMIYQDSYRRKRVRYTKKKGWSIKILTEENVFGTPRRKDDLPRFLQKKTCSVHQEQRMINQDSYRRKRVRYTKKKGWSSKILTEENVFGTPRGKDDLGRFLQNKMCSVHQEESMIYQDSYRIKRVRYTKKKGWSTKILTE